MSHKILKSMGMSGQTLPGHAKWGHPALGSDLAALRTPAHRQGHTAPSPFPECTRGCVTPKGQATCPAGIGAMLPLPTPHPGLGCLCRASPAPPAAPTSTGAHSSLQLSLTREMSLWAGNSSVESCTVPGLLLFLQCSGDRQFQEQSGHPDTTARLGFHQLGEWDTVGTWQECCP